MTGTPTPPDLSRGKPPGLEETSHQVALLSNGKGLEAHLRMAAVVLYRHRVLIIPSTEKDGIEALRSRSEVAALKAAVPLDEDHLAVGEIDVGENAAAQTSRDLDRQVMNVDSILRLIDGPLVVTTTVTTGLTIGRTHDILYGLQIQGTLNLLAGQGVIQR